MEKQFCRSDAAPSHGYHELTAPYGVWDWDLQRNLIYADAMAARIFGLCAEHARLGLPPESYFDKIHENDRQVIFDHSMQSISGMGACADNFRLVLQDGVKWVHSQGRCFADRDNKPHCFVGLVAEIGDPWSEKAPDSARGDVKGDDILYLCLHARRIAAETDRPFLVFLLEMAIAEASPFKSLAVS